ncbi:hypothetical protein CKA32_004152 [Geitlerinema sp. FC II]|nr:hypothetical protein CKA32_004152 [Geitlerinema sp. FC II]
MKDDPPQRRTLPRVRSVLAGSIAFLRLSRFGWGSASQNDKEV